MLAKLWKKVTHIINTCKKFCATTQFDASKVHSLFKSPYTLEDGLNKTLDHEFINPKDDDILFYSMIVVKSFSLVFLTRVKITIYNIIPNGISNTPLSDATTKGIYQYNLADQLKTIIIKTPNNPKNKKIKWHHFNTCWEPANSTNENLTHSYYLFDKNALDIFISKGKENTPRAMLLINIAPK